jgi:predicted dehydrogenase
MGEMRPRELTVGLVGLGYWGPNLLRVLVDKPGVQVRSICDLDGTRLSDFAHRHANVRATTCFDDLLQDQELDAIVLATPIHTHYGLAQQSLEAGKHTFVEKPLARTSEEAQNLIDLADANDRVLMCGQTFLYSPPVRATKRLIEQDELGDIYFISSSRVNLGLHQRDVSVIWDLGPHDFSILLYWLDEFPDMIRAVGRDSVVRGIPDVAFVTLTFPSGLLANIELSWLAPGKLRRTVVVGSKKMVVYEDGTPEPIKIFNHGVIYEDPETFGQYHLSYRTGDIVSPKLDSSEPIAVELDEFVSAVRAGAAPPGHLELGHRVVALAEAAQHSLDRDGARVALAGVV